NDFVTYVQGINDEIQFIAITAVSQFDILAQYNDFGLVDVVSDDAVALESRIVWSVDRACERLFLTYQNEQLFDDLQETKTQVEEVHKAAVTSMQTQQTQMPMPAAIPSTEAADKKSSVQISTQVGQYRSAQSKEDMIQRFLNNISGTMCVFFKFLPSVRSFVATHANGIPAAQIHGVGVQLEANDAKDLSTQLTMGLLPPRFNAMLVEAFHFNPPKALPLYGAQHLEGVFVYSGNLDSASTAQLSEEFVLFSLCYSYFILEKKVDALEVQDFVTELHNRNYYVKILTDEVSRALRLKQPVCVVKIAMDDFYEIESSLGETVRDELMKSVATVVAKSSRTNDQSCRTGANELAMILPHCSRKGAVLRAERLRRIVEGTSFLDNGMKMSISLGISEYPSLCD
ncbi:MAG TPA: GGDEF domain-containing protein, partial [Bdellovibrio sp.]|nr:GGDEF domain-containing protein [Bdellovibrio sp.]